MKHLGDITKINGWDVPVVDIVTGGSPCQDLSVAGKRAGLAGERSGLFMEQIRIIKEMREHDRANKGADVDFRLLKPRFMVWENVPGAFSSNGGEDFRAVLEETAKVVERDASIPRLEGGQDGLRPAASWEMGGQLLGEYTMRSFGEFPSEERESRLSQILEERPHPKYCLSARACQGILRRAEHRGKVLPEMLRTALLRQSASKNEQVVRGVVRESLYKPNGSEPYPPSTTNTSAPSEGSRSFTMQAFGAYADTGVASSLKQRDHKDATDLVIGSFYPQMKAESQCYREDGKANTIVNGTNPGFQNAVVYGIDRAAFNQGQNAQYDFSIEEELAQTIVSRGPGGVMHDSNREPSE